MHLRFIERLDNWFIVFYKNRYVCERRENTFASPLNVKGRSIRVISNDIYGKIQRENVLA